MRWFKLLSKKTPKYVILNKAKYYYQQNKERLKKQVRDKYRNVSEEEKNKKREYGKIDAAICMNRRKKD